MIMKKITPMEKLQPDKKASHKEIMDDFVQVESQVLNKMFDFIITNQLHRLLIGMKSTSTSR